MAVLFRSDRAVPAEARSNFLHLYLDIAWWAVLAASTISFTAVYAARLGASSFQIGLLSAGPAVVNLLTTLPAGRWLERQSMGPAVFWAAVFHRFFYVLWIPLPLLLAAQGQVWTLVALTLIMSIPGTALAVGFNALFAEAVPPEWRGHVAGIRNALLSAVFIPVSLLCGQILVWVKFPTGYQVVFALGLLGAILSAAHLWFIAPPARDGSRSRARRGLGALAWPSTRALLGVLRPTALRRHLSLRRPGTLLRVGVLRGRYGRFIAVLFGFYLSIYLAVPLFAPFWVNDLHLDDRQIGIGNALFYVTVFLGSTQLARLTRRLGNQRGTAIGAVFLCLFPALLSVSRGLGLFLVASAAGGLGWSLVGAALTNWLLEQIPADHRPAHLAWYNLAMNAALLAGSLLGPLIASAIPVRVALALFAALRIAAAAAIWLWERPGRGGVLDASG